jgi:hypothetical protein
VLINDELATLKSSVDLPVGDSSRWLTAFDAEADADADLAVVTDDPDLGVWSACSATTPIPS